jgi:ABC-type transport system involved in multi-copper enzyme maturation permease subunit
MDARIAKEVRSMTPTFGITLAVMVTLSLLIDGHEASDIVVFAFAGCCAMMSAAVFGNEFQARTMPLLLAQPVPRQRMWSDKMLVLGLALAVSAVFMLASIALFIRGEGRPESFKETVGAAAVIILCAFCSGPGITLRVKNTLTAMAITFCLPVAWFLTLIFLAWVGGKLTSSPDLLFNQAFHEHPSLPYWAAGAAALTYCALHYWPGRRSFIQFESADGQSQEIDLPQKLKGLAPFMTRFLPAYSGPMASLIRKELLLQRVSFMVAGFMTLSTAIGWLLYRLYPSDLTTTLTILFPILMCVLTPLLTGSVAIAEERNWGTLGWQLTLPISPRKQWLIKFAVAGLSCFVLGIVLFVVLGQISALITGTGFGPADPNKIVSTVVWMAVYLLMFGLMLYGSSISANVVRGILFGLGLVMGIGSVAALIKEIMNRLMPRWAATAGGHTTVLHIRQRLLDWAWAHKDWLQAHNVSDETFLLIFLMTLAILAVFIFCLLCRFAYVNFLNGEVNPRRSWRQVVVLMIVVNALTMPIFVGACLLDAMRDLDPAQPYVRTQKSLPQQAKPAPTQPDAH